MFHKLQTEVKTYSKADSQVYQTLLILYYNILSDIDIRYYQYLHWRY